MSDPNATGWLSVGDALRALPPVAPVRDAWPSLATQLARAQSPVRRRRWPLALAAACVLGIVAVFILRTPPASVSPATVATGRASSSVNNANAQDPLNMQTSISAQYTSDDNPVRIAALETRSQALERWLRDTARIGAPLPGQDLAAAAEIENLIGVVDVELAAAAHTDALPLWRRRVALLEDLTALRYSNYRLAEATAFAPDLGATHGIN